MVRLPYFFKVLLLVFLCSCQTSQQGSIEGTIVPPGKSIKVAAMQDGKIIYAVAADELNGKFKLPLAAGTYTISISSSNSSYPLTFANIIVKPGETSQLHPIELTPFSGKAILSGKVIPPRPNTEIKLLYEGKERAAAKVDTEGKYEFKELPAGAYVLQANAPGYADDTAQVVITENQKLEQNAVLVPISPIDGIDWASGKIRATGFGIPPEQTANESIRKAMARRAALADAQRNLLRIIEQIRIDADTNVKTAMADKNFASRITGFIKGYTVVSERELENGKAEIILELPLNGPAGLSKYLIQ